MVHQTECSQSVACTVVYVAALLLLGKSYHGKSYHEALVCAMCGCRFTAVEYSTDTELMLSSC